MKSSVPLSAAEEVENFRSDLENLIEANNFEVENRLDFAEVINTKIKLFIKRIEDQSTQDNEENNPEKLILNKLKELLPVTSTDENPTLDLAEHYASLFESKEEEEENKNLKAVLDSINLTYELREKEQKKSKDKEEEEAAIIIQKMLRGLLGKNQATELKEKKSKEDLEKKEKAALKIQKRFRGYLVRKKTAKPEVEDMSSVVDSGGGPDDDTNSLVDSDGVLEEDDTNLVAGSVERDKTSKEKPKPLSEPDTDKCLKNAIDLMKTYAGNRMDLNKDTFGRADKKGKVITLGKEAIRQLAELDPIRLHNSKFGGLTFDFNEAAPDDVKKFLKNTYCADFRNCTIKNLKLDKIFFVADSSSKALKEKEEILKNFSTVKFLNCKFEGYQPTPDFRFRVENIVNDKPTLGGVGLEATQISPPSGSPRATEIQQVAGRAKRASVELIARGGYTPSYNAGRGG